MSDKVAELASLLGPEDKAAWVTNLWTKYNDQRIQWVEEKKELRNYIFATDTTSTTNSKLPWKNSTTLPKLCQIRDNLHSNYLQALFPNEEWLQWEAHSREGNYQEKAEAVEAYMANKCRHSGYRAEVSKLLYDYIDYGNAFVTCSFVNKYKLDANGQKVVDYRGPVAHRISPLDIVFDPTAASFDNSFKVVRSLKTLGELKLMSEYDNDQTHWGEALEKRLLVQHKGGAYSVEDFNKASGYQVDGFGDMKEYLMSNFVEVLEFYGDYHDHETGEVHTNRLVTVVDRNTVVRDVPIPTYTGAPAIRHVGWRGRPDNLWAMGPLDNLVGMQYRIDHLENLKADAQDLVVHPPLKIIGEVEEFEWGPGVEVHIDENGDVQEISKNLGNIIMADNAIQQLEDKMEMFAGAPREAMGIRTPGEKTAFEVSSLQNAAGRIFQEKVSTFELLLLEPNLNDMLEVSHRNMTEPEEVGVMNKALNLQVFREISKADIQGDGVIRPIGARHFAEQAKFIQEFSALSASGLMPLIQNHISGEQLAKAIAGALNVEKLNIFSPNVALKEQMKTQQTASAMEEQQIVEDSQEMPPV